MRTFDSTIAETDWLQHRWDFRIAPFKMQGRTTQQVKLGGLVLSEHNDRGEAQRAIAGIRVESLAAIIARKPAFHPARAIIVGYIPERSGERLASIRPELWATYDGIELEGVAGAKYVAILSAKARALFPDAIGVFIRVMKR